MPKERVIRTDGFTEKDYRKFASLFVNGPAGVAGNIASCQEITLLGINPADPKLRDAVIAEGGQPTGPVDTLPVPKIKLKLKAPVDLDQVAKEIEKPKSEDEWQKLAKSLKGTIDDIASGEVKASAAQAAMLKHILDRAYGRVSAQANEKRPASGILILPTLGERSNMQCCPRCGLELTPKSEDIPSEPRTTDGLSS